MGRRGRRPGTSSMTRAVPPPVRRRWLECRVPPPLVVGVTAAVMWALAPTSSEAWPPVVRAAGPPLCLVGLWLAGWAVRAFRQASTTIHPLRPDASSALVVTGPNRWSRNPMYVGMLMALGGWGLWLGGGASLAGVGGAWLWLHWLQVVPEERVLPARFGTDYLAYCDRVRRWL